MKSSRPKITRYLFGALALASLVVPKSALSQEEEAPDGVALAKARLYLKDFQDAVDKDEEKARKAFDVLIEMGEFARKGFGRYLDGEWERRATAYRHAASRAAGQTGPAVTSEIGSNDKLRAREHRATLARIRAMPNETEMKKELKATGWSTLQSLLGIFKRAKGGDGSTPGGDYTLPGKKVAALKIGKFRQEFHKHVGNPLPRTPEEELGLAKEGDEAEKKAAEVQIRASAAADAILEQNEQLFSQIEAAEAKGIRQLNEWRIAAGLNPLLVDPKLCAAARDHCKDMASRGFFSHTSPIEGKRTFTQRAKNFGTSARAENIAINSSSESANHSWFYSPGHHKNMFGNHTAIGFGGHGRHFCQMFR